MLGKKQINIGISAILIVLAVLALIAASTKLSKDEQISEEVFANEANLSLGAPTPEDKAIIVAIDAGHGGEDGGAAEYVLEKDMTEKTVKYLEEFLTKDENFTPVLCREYGEGAKVSERAQAANDAGAQLLISVHGNTDPTRTATGFESFPAPPGREHHEASLRFAQLIASRMGEAGQRLRGERGVRYKYYEELPSGKSKEVIAEESDTERRSESSFGIVEKPDCPAVLVEQCFLTSKSDAEKWASDEGCQRAAQIYYEAICEYFGTESIVA